MKTIKTLFVMAVIISSVACRNESAVVDDSPSCEDLISFAVGDLDVAKATIGDLTNERSAITSERDELLEAGTLGLSSVVSETMLTDLDEEIKGMDQRINAQIESIADIRVQLASAIAACPSANQQELLADFDFQASALEDVVSREQSINESAQEVIDRLSPQIIEVSELIQALEAEKEEAEFSRGQLVSSGLPAEAIAVNVVPIDNDIAAIEEDLLQARRKYTQLSDARRYAYLSLNQSNTVASADTE